MVEEPGRREFETKTDVEVLAEHARSLERAGLLRHALWVWRDVLQRDGNYLPAWEASSRLRGTLSRQDGENCSYGGLRASPLETGSIGPWRWAPNGCR